MKNVMLVVIGVVLGAAGVAIHKVVTTKKPEKCMYFVPVGRYLVEASCECKALAKELVNDSKAH